MATLLDYFNVIAGSSATFGGAVHIVPPMYFPECLCRRRLPAALKATVTSRCSSPAASTSRRSPRQVLASGQADMCGMTRAMICDPEMPRKAAEGRLDDIRACIACNQACIGHFHMGYPISCIQHPETGRELRLARKPMASPERSA